MNEARFNPQDKAMKKPTASPTEQPTQIIILQPRPTLAQWC